MITEYEICTADSPHNLIKTVQRFLDKDEGWEPHGPVFEVDDSSVTQMKYNQAIVKKTDEKSKTFSLITINRKQSTYKNQSSDNLLRKLIDSLNNLADQIKIFRNTRNIGPDRY